jgi:hypothetical protein
MSVKLRVTNEWVYSAYNYFSGFLCVMLVILGMDFFVLIAIKIMSKCMFLSVYVWAKNSNLHKPEEPTIFEASFVPIFDVSKSLFRKSTKILESHFLKHPVNFTISFSSKPQNTVKKLKRKSLRGECQFQSFKIQLLLRW